ncbi:TraM recognition domain-containing protein [Streptomyces europaeiscabiei]|uniref:type IV secretory system conjugative DNA transfer family protein n=1 Tax=Streptomyces europaeiscabiei TaxID=146819 RepID=UPI0029B26806|nr:TraM recognition domain-containing protein [Streptomyces europaeiscabiei]MDX3695967.1 TraM recognition domain-containing protein [Streptomyces europaeiscabiei]
MTHTYRLNFAAGLDADQVATWLTAVSGTLTTGPRRLVNVSSLVFEVEADERGIQYRLVVPEETADFLTGQLRALIPGSTATPAGGEEPPRHWTAAVELGQTNPRRSLDTVNPATTAASLLAAMQGLGRGEALLLQWVVSPALRQRPPRAANELVLPGRRFTPRPDRDRINDVRAKLSEPNFLGVLRVAVKAPTKVRDEHLLARVRSSLAAVGSSSNRLKQRLTTSGRVVSRVESRAVPTLFPMQLAGSELVALICWPIGSPHVAGLPRSRTRQLAATGAVPRTGRVIARSNFPGNDRPLALGVVESAQHLQVVGPTGSGKTALLTNLIAQDMNAGRGVVLIESKGDLFQAVLDRVPERRLSDVVLLDVSDTEYPVGFNILTGSPYVVAADIQRLFDHLYPQDARGVRVRAGFYHLILTLMLSTGGAAPMTFADIGALAVPGPDQQDFAARLIRGVSHVDQLASWWQGFSDARTRATHFQPILDRIWQLNNRPSIRNIIGQSRSTLNLADIMRRRKILLVNLGRATEGRDTAGLLGSLLLNSVWSAVQAGAANPERPTMLYLDEFQDFLNLPISPADMFAQARSLGLAMTVAHQHLGQLTRELQDATKNNARSTVVFQTSADEARDFSRQFGRSVTDDDFVNLARFEVLMRLATTDGVSSPMSAVTYPPVDPTDSADIVRRLSRRTYARPVAEVEAEIKQRRGQQPAPRASTRRPRFGGPRNGS